MNSHMPSRHPNGHAYWQLIRGDRPVGTLLLLWPTLWALWLAAGGLPPLKLLLVFGVGVWLTRSAGCIINDYADRWLDHRVERTKTRPLVSGWISPREALTAFVLMMLAAFGLVLLTNPLTIGLSVVGALLAATYPYLKRHTYFPQVYLGIAFGWGIPMAFAAVQGEIPRSAWLLFLGDMDLAGLGVLFAGFLAAMVLLGRQYHFGLHYFLCLAAAGVVILWQFEVARLRHREDCFRAFLANQWVGMPVFVGIAAPLLYPALTAPAPSTSHPHAAP